MANFNGKFDTVKQDWITPDTLFQKLQDEFRFTLDLAANEQNTKCSKFYSEEENALSKHWSGICWLNPPYGKKDRKLSDWIYKAWTESQKPDCTVVMLIPARTNTNWWHNYCMKSAEVRFIKGRPKFGDATHGLPQPLAIIIFKQHSGETKFSSFYIG